MDAHSALKWLADNKMQVTSPIPFCDFYREYSERIGSQKTKLSCLNACVKRRLAKPEKLDDFTLNETIQMLFLLSVPVTSTVFKTILHNTGTFKLDDGSRIVHYRSHNGNFEVMGVHKKYNGTLGRLSGVSNATNIDDYEDIQQDDSEDIMEYEPEYQQEPEDPQNGLVFNIKREMTPVYNVKPIIKVDTFSNEAQPICNAHDILRSLYCYVQTLDTTVMQCFKKDLLIEMNKPGKSQKLVTEELINSNFQIGLRSVIKSASTTVDPSAEPLSLLEFLRALKLQFLLLGMLEDGPVIKSIVETIRSEAESSLVVPMTRIHYALQSIFESAT